MDNIHAHPSSSPISHRTHPLRDRDAASLLPSPPNRQQRLLRSRNARFPAKKISISGISARFSQMISPNDGDVQPDSIKRKNQENFGYRNFQRAANSITTPTTSGILNRIASHKGYVGRDSKGSRSITIFEGSPERPLLDESPYNSPSFYYDLPSEVQSPMTFSNVNDPIENMGLKEISGNARRLSLTQNMQSPGPAWSGRKIKLKQITSNFDSEEYIEHIERELELVKNAMNSPNTNQPWKQKLKVARAENARLRKEISELKESFEADVQKTVEHMTSTEADLRRRNRSLEEDLEQKVRTIHELEYEHEEKRLDQSIIDTLKATIEKIEQEKFSLKDSNCSLSKRNEVLSQLLAQSPTRSQFENESTNVMREPRRPRPMSLMSPRILSTPSPGFSSRPCSLIMSPTSHTAGYFSPYAAVPSPSNQNPDANVESPRVFPGSTLRDLCSDGQPEANSRRSTIVSQSSASPQSWSIPLHFSPNRETNENLRQPQKRKARKFMTGSTQLKPLLLPTLSRESNSIATASPVTSPRGYSSDSVMNAMTECQDRLSGSPSLSERLDGTDFVEHTTIADEASLDAHYQNCAESPGVDSERSLLKTRSAALSGGLHLSLEDCPGLPTESIEEMISFPAKPARPRVECVIKRRQNNNNTCVAKSQTQEFAADRDNVSERDLENFYLPYLHAHTPNPASSPLSYLEGGVSLPEVEDLQLEEHLFSPCFSVGHDKSTIDASFEHRSPAHQSTQSGFKTPSKSRKRRKECSSIASLPDDLSLGHGNSPSAAIVCRPVLIPTSVLTEPEQSQSPTESPASKRKTPSRPCSPVEILQRRSIRGQPLVMVSVRTVYGILSKYTSYIKQIKSDPLALARRVIANAWHTHWNVLGKLSWWVLGLFLGPGSLQPPGSSQGWDDYDGESIAHRCCNPDEEAEVETGNSTSRKPFVNRDRNVNGSLHTTTARNPEESDPRLRTSWCQSLFLWGKFSVAIMLAVSGAVVKGPAEMLRDINECCDEGNRAHLHSNNMGNASRSSHSQIKRQNMTEASGCRSLRTSDSGKMSASTQVKVQDIDDSIDRTSCCFDTPSNDHEINENDDYKTLKPTKNGRAPLADVCRAMKLDGAGEYDPESAGVRSFQSLLEVSPSIYSEVSTAVRQNEGTPVFDPKCFRYHRESIQPG